MRLIEILKHGKNSDNNFRFSIRGSSFNHFQNNLPYLLSIPLYSPSTETIDAKEPARLRP